VSSAVAGGAGLTTALAGCGEITSQATARTYEAEPVALDEVVSSDMARSLLRELGLARYADVDWQGGPGDDELVPMLGDEAETADFRSGEGADEKRLRVARVQHEGDVVFGVGVATLPDSTAATPTPDDAGSNDDGTVDTSPGAWWTNWRKRWRRGLNRGHRAVPQCYQSSIPRFVEIDQPHDGAIVDVRGNTDANMEVRLPRFGAIEFDAKATAVGYCIDHLEWSQRLDPKYHSGSKCGYSTSWTSLGTGYTQTFRWMGCDEIGLSFEIRVEAVDSGGSVLFSDTHKVEYQTPG
jgi:hypothetical protein